MARLRRGSTRSRTKKTNEPTIINRIKKNTSRHSNKKELERLMMKNPSTLTKANRNTLASRIRLKCISQLQTQNRYGKKKSSSSVSSDTRNDVIQTRRGQIPRNGMRRQNVVKQMETLGAIRKSEEIRKGIKSVEWDEKSKCIHYENIIRNRINNDPCLAGYYNRNIGNTINVNEMKLMSAVAHAHFGRETETDEGKQDELISFDDELIKVITNGIYIPPTRRLLIIGQKADYWRTEALMFSDIRGETARNTLIPDTFYYKYTNKNYFDSVKYKKLADFTRESENPQNIIRCECCTGGLMKKCWENKDCPCYQANKKLRELQIRKDSTYPITNISTFGPIILPPADTFFDTIGFACSDACACGGQCTNNATFLIEKNLVQLEQFRKDPLMGYRSRTMTMIPLGVPPLEFTGELSREVNPEDGDYAFAIIDPNDNFQERTFGNPKNWSFMNWSAPFIAKMMEQLTEVWYLNPKRIGNIARTVCHSCEPNLTTVRVFQKSFSPANCRLLLVTQETVFPSEELSYDYGAGYLKENLNSNCLCEKPACKSSKVFDKLKNASLPSLECYQSLRYHYRYAEYKKNIIDEIGVPSSATPSSSSVPSSSSSTSSN